MRCYERELYKVGLYKRGLYKCCVNEVASARYGTTHPGNQKPLQQGVTGRSEAGLSTLCLGLCPNHLYLVPGGLMAGGLVGFWTGGQVDRWTGGCLDRWAGRQVDRWTGGCLERWAGESWTGGLVVHRQLCWKLSALF